ncbi:formate dehydrogenase subunit alpha, partial [Streptomyces scabiei]
VRKVMPAVAGKEDWEVTVDLANALGYSMSYNHPSEIMDEIALLTPSFAGVSYEKLDKHGSLQWPCNDEFPIGSPIMHMESFPMPEGKG